MCATHSSTGIPPAVLRTRHSLRPPLPLAGCIEAHARSPLCHPSLTISRCTNERQRRRSYQERGQSSWQQQYRSSSGSAGKTSRKRSAPEAQQSDPVVLPPRRLARLVIHYRDAAFHVHKFILYHHSAYFRTYIDQLTDGERAYSNDECSDHVSIAHCVRLPDRCGKVDASVDDFRLFLYHLYFPRQYNCIPYHMADVHIDLTADLPPTVSLDSPAFPNCRELLAATSNEILDAPAIDEAVLSLCHYFDCALLLSRAEDNLRLVVGAEQQHSVTNSAAEIRACVELACKFNLQRLKKACIVVLANYCRGVYNWRSDDDGKPTCISIVELLDKDSLVALVTQMHSDLSADSLSL